MNTGIPALLDSVMVNLFAALADDHLDTALDAYAALADYNVDGHQPAKLSAMSNGAYRVWLLAMNDMLAAMSAAQ